MPGNVELPIVPPIKPASLSVLETEYMMAGLVDFAFVSVTMNKKSSTIYPSSNKLFTGLS